MVQKEEIVNSQLPQLSKPNPYVCLIKFYNEVD